MYEVAEMLDISYGSAYATLHDESGSWKACAKWVPRQLTDPHKQHRMKVATQFCNVVKKIQAYGAALSLAMTCGCIIMMLKARDKAGDGNILVLHEKRSSEAYLYQKILLTFLWDKKGPILELYQEKDQTVSNATCSAMLKDKVKPANCNKRKGLLSKTVLLHHDNTHPHVVVATI